MDKVSKADYRIPNYISAEAKDLIKRLLQKVPLAIFYSKDPAQRIGLSKVLNTAFFDPKLQTQRLQDPHMIFLESKQSLTQGDQGTPVIKFF